MQLINIYSALALLQASAWAVTVSPKCNGDNCLRGLFGSNAKATSANLAACSTGLPTVTVRVDGTMRTTMTGTAAPPAAASVCDGQGIASRAARFKSACSCVGVMPSTVTLTATPSAAETTLQTVATTTTQVIVETTQQMAAETSTSAQPSSEVTTQIAMETTTQTTAETTTQAQTSSEVTTQLAVGTTTQASLPEVTLGQVASSSDSLRNLSPGIEFYTDNPIAYVVPRDGQIVSASIFDSGTGVQVSYFKVWRKVGGDRIQLVGRSDTLILRNTQSVKQFPFSAPIAVQAGDLIGHAPSGTGTFGFGIVSPGDNVSGRIATSSGVVGSPPIPAGQRFLNTRLNLAAVLQ